MAGAIYRFTRDLRLDDHAGLSAAAAHGDTELQAAIEEAGAQAIVVHDAPAIPPEESTAARSSGGEGYRAFVPYYEVWRELDPGSFEAPLLLSFARGGMHSDPLPKPQD